MNTIERLAWLEASKWAGRDDLPSDTESTAYKRAMYERTKALATEAGAEFAASREQVAALAQQLEAAERREKGLREFRNAVVGWREVDYPEGFCRRTADMVVEFGLRAEAALAQSQEVVNG